MLKKITLILTLICPIIFYAQNKPLQAYVAEGYELFEDMLNRISQEVVGFCLRMRVEVRKK